MTTQRWQDLPDLQAVARAQADGWEIEVDSTGKAGWIPWNKNAWMNYMEYRGRPKQPKTRKIKMLCWWDETTGKKVEQAKDFPVSGCWHRVPSGDSVIEVEE